MINIDIILVESLHVVLLCVWEVRSLKQRVRHHWILTWLHFDLRIEGVILLIFEAYIFCCCLRLSYDYERMMMMTIVFYSSLCCPCFGTALPILCILSSSRDKARTNLEMLLSVLRMGPSEPWSRSRLSACKPQIRLKQKRRKPGIHSV